MLVFTNAAKRELLSTVVAPVPGAPAAGPWNGCKIGLFQNDFNPTGDMVLADLTVATFTGYALSAAVTFGTAFSDDNGNAKIAGDIKQFDATGTAVPNTVYGAYIVDSAGTTLLAVDKFDSTRTMDGLGDAIRYEPVIDLISLAS